MSPPTRVIGLSAKGMATLQDRGGICAGKIEQEQPLEAKDEELSREREKSLAQAALEDAILASNLNSLSTSEDPPEGDRNPGVLSPDDSSRASSSLRSSHHRNVKWVDITAKFTGLADKLVPGVLVQDPEFSLYEAMSAIELMDSKMDASLQWVSFKGYPRSMEEALATGRLTCDGHSPVELIGVMDEVLACIATWLEGHTLAQTVFTCMYLLDIDKVENIYLRSFSLAIVKTVEYMRACICQGRVFAEDDQQGLCLGLDMLNQVSETAINSSLKQAEEQLQLMLRHAPATASDPGEKAEFQGSSLKSWKVLHLRIRFVKNLFAFVIAMGKNNLQGIESGLSKLSLSASLMSEMRETIDIGQRLDSKDPLLLGFHPVINQHLLPPSYKPYAILPRDVSFGVLKEVLLQIRTIIGFGKVDSFRELFHSIKYFSLGSKCPSVLVRSLLVLVSIQGDRKKLFGSRSLEELIREDVKNFVLPPSLNSRSPVSTAPQAKEVTERFLGQSVMAIVEFLRVFCQHRARQRYKIVRCLEILGEFQQDTQRMDEILNAVGSKFDTGRIHSSSFSTWVLYYILQMMIEFVCLGFEFDLYSPFEVHYVYWYLEFLYGWHETSIKSAERLHLVEAHLPTKGKRKQAKKSKLQHTKERERESAVVRVKRIVCVGLMRALEGLLIDHRIPMPEFEHSNIKFCFQNRFLPFASLISPQLLSYADYKRLASIDNYKTNDLNLYEASAKHFQSAKACLESIPHRGEELEGLLKVIKTNLVVMNLTAKGHKRDSKSPPIFDYSLHQHFPVIRLN